jgi:hypothetical protein
MLKLFEIIMVRKISGPQKDVVRNYSILYNEELRDLHRTACIVNRMKCGGLQRTCQVAEICVILRMRTQFW